MKWKEVTLSRRLRVTNASQSPRRIQVISPRKGAVFSSQDTITVEWLDNGETPVLPDIGTVTVGLYHGRQQLIQSLQAVNVEESHSITFTPNPNAGPNSDGYYISFISASLQQDGVPHAAFSPFFSLRDMQGSFDSPLESATTSISVPASLLSSRRPSQLSTVTIGTLSPISAIPTLAPTTPSSFITISSIPVSTPPSATPTSPPSSALASSSQLPNGSPVLGLPVYLITILPWIILGMS